MLHFVYITIEMKVNRNTYVKGFHRIFNFAICNVMMATEDKRSFSTQIFCCGLFYLIIVS